MMSENYQQSMRRKTRSASICAPGSSSMEQMLSTMPPPGKENRIGKNKDSGSATPDSGCTPTRRRRPATRSQSARVSGANKSIRRRAAQQAASQQEYSAEALGSRSAHYNSEPRLTDNEHSPGLRRRGSRRGQSVHHSHQRKVNAYLDVPDVNSRPPVQRDDILDDDLYRLRSFSLTSKGEIHSSFYDHISRYVIFNYLVAISTFVVGT
ncbi:hypothetical protein QAD02_019247 [Eretmocerus hayati]|uniref:Uncharacterized protein n=1 Tax=Eretmocerus hayati TaxID=131215 RepID=A0ACC2PIN9_9HYME|nr:hypothetical protein QAD02_019247 [Eretmocerus hayati]